MISGHADSIELHKYTWVSLYVGLRRTQSSHDLQGLITATSLRDTVISINDF